jgi:hypothetical protein
VKSFSARTKNTGKSFSVKPIDGHDFVFYNTKIVTGKNANPRRRNQHWPGLRDAAKALGVSYGHLRLCLVGQRESKSLLARYNDLNSSQPNPTTPQNENLTH